MIREIPIRQYQQATIDLNKIRAVAGNPDLQESEVFDFPPFVICRSGRNHNRTDITGEGQRAAVGEWVGKPVYFKDHEMKADNQIGRIYDAWVKDEGGATVTYGRAFAVKTDDDADLQAKIRNRQHKEMSCAYDVVKSACSVCGTDTTTAHCVTHEKQSDYMARDLAFAPHHLSFTGDPAVPGSGLVTHAREQQDPEALKTLTRDAEDGREFRRWASAEFAKWYGLANPGVHQDEVKGLTEKLSAREMVTLARVQHERFKEIIPDGRQQLTAPQDATAPSEGPQFKNVNDYFRSNDNG